MQPMTAVAGLPAGWQMRTDPEGKAYYENTVTGATSRTPPGGLPPGWRETKDPDGKSFFVHDQLQIASWHRPGEQPPPPARKFAGGQVASPTPSTATLSISAHSSTNPSKPNQMIVSASKVKRKPIESATISANVKPTLQTATVATINLVDPTEGAIVRNTLIAAHITGQGVNRAAKAVKDNRRLQNFARGTGLAAANRHVKKAWRKAANEVDSLRMQELVIKQSGTSGDVLIEDLDDNFQGEYFLESDDGTIECYGPDRKLRRTIRGPNQAQPGKVIQPAPLPQQHQLLIQNPPLQRQQTMPSNFGHQDVKHSHFGAVEYSQTTEFYASQDQNIYVDAGAATYISEPQFVMQEQNVYVEIGTSAMANESQYAMASESQYAIADQSVCLDTGEATYVSETQYEVQEEIVVFE
jgi:hypothetical protein